MPSKSLIIATLIAATCVCVQGDPPASRERAAPQTEEEHRLLNEVSRLGHENGVLLNSLKKAQFEAETLRKENEDLRSAIKRDSAGKMLRELMRHLRSELIKASIAEEGDVDQVFVSFGRWASEWAGARETRRDFIANFQQWVSSVEARADDKVQPAEPTRPSPINHPSVIREQLATKSRPESAKLIASLLGREVRWHGTIVDVEDNMFIEHQFVMESEGITVNLIVNAAPGRAMRVGLGDDVEVRGRIREVKNYGWLGVEVDLEGCSICPEKR